MDTGKDLFHYAWLVGLYWLAIMGVFFLIAGDGADWVLPSFKKKLNGYIPTRVRRAIELTIMVLVIFYAGFQTWHDEHERANQIDRQRQGAQQWLATWKARADERWGAIHGHGGYLDRLAAADAKPKLAPIISARKHQGLDLKVAAKMAELMDRGMLINKAFWDNNDTAILKRDTNVWVMQVLDFLTPIDPAYGIRFASAHGERVVADTTHHDIEGSTIFNSNIAKFDVLTAIAQEMSAKGITSPASSNPAPSVGKVAGNGNIIAPGMSGGSNTVNNYNGPSPPVWRKIRENPIVRNPDGTYSRSFLIETSSQLPQNNVAFLVKGPTVLDIELNGVGGGPGIRIGKGVNPDGWLFDAWSSPTSGQWNLGARMSDKQAPLDIDVKFNVQFKNP